MPKAKRKPEGDPLPESFGSLEEFWEFWDTHSTADYEDLMEEADVCINVRSSKTYCALAKDLLAQVRAEARRQGVSAEALIHLWLAERLKQQEKTKAK
jgi:hypothetical protein